MWCRRRDADCAQAFFPCIRNPIRCPRWRQLRFKAQGFNAMGLQRRCNSLGKYAGCGTAGVVWHQAYHELIVFPARVTHNAQINHRDDGNFRIGHFTEPRPNLSDAGLQRSRYHVAFG